MLENKDIKGTYNYILRCIHNDSAFSEQGHSSTLIHLNALLKSTLIIAYWDKLLVALDIAISLLNEVSKLLMIYGLLIKSPKYTQILK